METLLLRGILLIVCALFNLMLAFLLFAKRRKNKTAFHLGFVALFSSIYCFTSALADLCWQRPFSYGTKLFWTRATWSGILAVSSYFIFLYYFTKRTKYIKLKILFWYILPVIFYFLVLTTPYFIESINVESEGVSINPGKLDVFGRLYAIITITTGLIYILREYLKSTGLRKLQIKYLVTGFVIYSIGGIVFTGILPLLAGKTDPYVDISALLSSLWVGLTSYAIIRYRLMDIRLVIGKGAVYLLSFTTIIVLSFLLMFLNNQFAQPLSFNAVLLLGAFCSLLFFQLIKFYEKIANEYFYHTFYNTKIVIAELEEKLTQVLELRTFSSLITNTLINTLKLEKIGILIRTVGDTSFLPKKMIGFSGKETLVFLEDKFLSQYLQKNKKAILQEELTFLIAKAKEEEKEKLQKLQAKMKETRAGLLLPFIFERNLIGIIILGNKVSGNAFSSQDIDLLTILSRSASIALKNASLYSEMKNRKEDLEKFYRLTVGRELKMRELKKKIVELEEILREKG
jgi:hypothetical protein